MKKLVILILVLFISNITYTQTDIFRSMTPIMDSLTRYINIIEKYNIEVVKTETEIISKNISKSTFRNFYKNWTYSVLVFGDWRIKEISVEIFKITEEGQNIYIKGCHDKKHFAIIDFKPDEDETYMIVVTANKFITDFYSGHYGLMIFHN